MSAESTAQQVHIVWHPRSNGFYLTGTCSFLGRGIGVDAGPRIYRRSRMLFCTTICKVSASVEAPGEAPDSLLKTARSQFPRNGVHEHDHE